MNKLLDKRLFIHIVVTISCLTVFYFITIMTKPFPVSDFLYYWDYVDDLSQYYKGGLLFLPYLPLKLLGLEPFISAFIVNSLCFIGLSYTFWLGKDTKLQYLSTLFLGLTAIWFSGYIPIVNSDIPTITIWLLGISLFLKFLNTRQKFYMILAILSFLFSLSIRSQLYYISIVILIISLISMLLYHRHLFQAQFETLKFLSILLTVSIILSFISGKLLESQSSETELIKFHKRATFYTGLLETPQDGVACGGWNIEALQRTTDEMNTPLINNIEKGILSLPREKLINTIFCKWEKYIFEYNQSGFLWLEIHITQGWTIEKNFGEFWGYYKHIEYFAANILKLFSFSLIFLFFSNIKKYQKTEIVVFFATVGIILLFLLIHTILEIQARYIIAPVLTGLTLSLYLHSGLFKNVKW